MKCSVGYLGRWAAVHAIHLHGGVSNKIFILSGEKKKTTTRNVVEHTYDHRSGTNNCPADLKCNIFFFYNKNFEFLRIFFVLA